MLFPDIDVEAVFADFVEGADYHQLIATAGVERISLSS